MENYEEKICSCALNRIFGFSPKTGHALISQIGSASEVFRLKEGDIEHLIGPYSKYRGQICNSAVEKAAEELERLEKMDIRFTACTEAGYPELLRECEDPPIGLYVRSTTPPEQLWTPRRRIAVVGTRDLSPYGREWCQKAVSGLALTSEKPTIVSGLAIGADFHAHKSALENGLPTIGVMATGPEEIYPYRHREFAEKLFRTPGCALVTDYPPGTPPLAVHFLRRNRIIAGLSEATLVMESKLKGGAMMTARLAFSYNREVYALPGRADDIRSQGCNQLIRSKIAEPITSVEDLLESLDMRQARRLPRASAADILHETYRNNISSEEFGAVSAIFGMIMKNRGITIEEISDATGINYPEVSRIANVLEADGLIFMDLMQRCCANIRK